MREKRICKHTHTQQTHTRHHSAKPTIVIYVASFQTQTLTTLYFYFFKMHFYMYVPFFFFSSFFFKYISCVSSMFNILKRNIYYYYYYLYASVNTYEQTHTIQRRERERALLCHIHCAPNGANGGPPHVLVHAAK
jgi:hypothetical protein